MISLNRTLHNWWARALFDITYLSYLLYNA
jgi:hypothetical protein